MLKNEINQRDRLTVKIISTGFFWGDAGIVFGTLPKTLYDKISHPNSNNKIKLFLNCLLIETMDSKIIIDTGLGNIPFKKTYPGSSNHIVEELHSIGITREKIDHVILTHLHPDHCGGVVLKQDQKLQLSFPNAIHYIQQKEWETANNPDQLNKPFYNISPILQILEKSDNLKLINGDFNVDQHIDLIFTGGHSEGHQIVEITGNNYHGYFVSDLIPTHYHKKMGIYSSQDICKKIVFQQKMKLLNKIDCKKDHFYYYHEMNTRPEIK